MKDIAKWIVYGGVFSIPFIVLIISNSLFFPFITGKNFTFRIIVEIVTAAWVVLALYDVRYRPRYSWILGGFCALLFVMFLADVHGVNPSQSFWSNFERMEGYVTLIHVFLYFLVVSSMLVTDVLWNRFFNTTLFAAVLLSLYAFAQLSGDVVINQGGWRLDGTLGNSAYMAVYMLFHFFIALLMLARTTIKKARIVYGFLALLFAFLLIQTATRGTILGLVGGLGMTALYLLLTLHNAPKLRRYAGGLLIALVLLGGLFYKFRDASVIQDNPYLSRVANITLTEGTIRFKIWHMAFDAFKERPLLGWGQSNFNYVFNQKYDPSLYGAESWYDRAHNIVFDWLVTGGILGALGYFSVYFFSVFYVAVQTKVPSIEGSPRMTQLERGIVMGLLAGYLFHNLFVFDNIVSYIFYGTMLAFIHSVVARKMRRFETMTIARPILEQIIVPVSVIVLMVTIYWVNVPALLAAGDIITALKSKSPETILDVYDRALSRDSFGNQEIREQMTRQAQTILLSKDASSDIKERAKERVEEELKKQISEKPNDARVHVFASSFYRMLGDTDDAIRELRIARSLSPKKQQIIFEQGIVELQAKNYDAALEFFKEAYELAPHYTDAAVFYAAGALYAGKPELVEELIDTPDEKRAFAESDLALQAANSQKMYPLLSEMLRIRIEENPTDPQARTSLAYILSETGDKQGAIAVLKKAGEDIPSFKAQADAFIKGLEDERVQ